LARLVALLWRERGRAGPGGLAHQRPGEDAAGAGGWWAIKGPLRQEPGGCGPGMEKPAWSVLTVFGLTLFRRPPPAPAWGILS